MNSKLTSKTILLAAGLTVCGYAAAGGAFPRVTQPIIAKVAMSHEGNALVITGWHFGNASPPTVHLAGQVLKIKRFSESEVVAALPTDFGQATYSLTVTSNGHKRATSDAFNASLPGAAHAINRAGF